MNHPRRRSGAVATAVALSALAATAAAPTAASAATKGTTTIELTGAVARSLRAQGVRTSARKPAKATRTRITLPVAGGRIARTATLRHRGSVTFRTRSGRRTRTATFTNWQTKLAPRKSTITAKLGKRRVPLFVLTFPKRARSSATKGGTVRLTTSTLRLTTQGAKTLRRTLEIRTLPAGVLGRAKVSATIDNGSGGGTDTGGGNTGGSNAGGGGSGGGGSGGGGRTTPVPTPTPTPRPDPRCRGFDIGTIPGASTPLTRPPGVPSLAAAVLWWRPKDSWIRYINTGSDPGDGVLATDGASNGPAERLPGSSAALVYRYAFTPDLNASWYQPSTRQGVVYFTGQVHFKWAAHELDITMKAPEVQVDGTRGRVVFRFAGDGCTSYGDRRIEFTTFTPSAPPGAPAYDFGSLPQTLTAPGNTAFGSMYASGMDWGSIDLSLTTG